MSRIHKEVKAMKKLSDKLRKHIELLVSRYPVLEGCEDSIVQAYFVLEKSYADGHKLLVAGNGGSAADAEHIVGELMKGFKLSRKLDSQMSQKLSRKMKNLVRLWQRIFRGHCLQLRWMVITRCLRHI